jgi:hypothetical protein
MGLLLTLLNLLAGAWRRPPVLVTLALNLIPVACVLWLGWSALLLLAVYWMENVVIGLFNILKMAASTVAKPLKDGVAALFAIPFFTVHYGGFCAAHGLFTVLVGAGAFSGDDPFAAALPLLSAHRESLFWTAGALAGSHAAAFLAWLWRGEFRRADPMSQMAEPYGRIFVLHLTLLGGAFLVVGLHGPVWAVALLGLLKTFYEVVVTSWRIEKRKAKAEMAAAEMAA